MGATGAQCVSASTRRIWWADATTSLPRVLDPVEDATQYARFLLYASPTSPLFVLAMPLNAQARTVAHKLIEFIDASPSSWHAVASAEERLLAIDTPLLLNHEQYAAAMTAALRLLRRLPGVN